MSRILNYSKYTFLKEETINEDYGSEFLQYQFGLGPQPLGPGYGFAQDPQLSIYGSADSPYTDHYARSSAMVKDLQDMMDYVYKRRDYSAIKNDRFIEDINLYENLKILRLNINHMGYIDVFISFDFNEEEYFGVFHNFNWIQKPSLRSDLFKNRQLKYIDHEYVLKLSNYFYKILINWFSPEVGFYKNLLADNIIKNEMGESNKIKEGAIIELIETEVDNNNMPYIKLKINDKLYIIDRNDYYWFKYRFEKIKDIKK